MKASIFGSLFNSDPSSSKVDELIKSKVPDYDWFNKENNDNSFTSVATTTKKYKEEQKDYKPKFVEIINKYSETGSAKDTVLSFYLISTEEPRFSMVFDRYVNAFNPITGITKNILNINFVLNGVAIRFNNYIAAEVAYNKIKEMTIGKGNNYIQIEKGIVKALTIPTSKKKKKEEEDNLYDEPKGSTGEVKESKV